MNSNIIKKILVVVVFHIWAIGFAQERIDTNKFRVVSDKAHELASTYGVENVLIVYDTDNTLLAMNQDLGSDQWFNWQASLITAGTLKDAVALDFPGLLSVQGKLFALGSMSPPDSNAPVIVSNLQNEGFYSIVLTSRGFDYRDSTLRELKRNGYQFLKSSLHPQGGFPSTYLPYDLKNISDYGLSEGDIQKLKLGVPRPASFMDGIFMTSGQHKGAMLRTLLWKTDHSFPSILFVDDQTKNCDAIQAAFENQGVHVVTIRYSLEDDRVKRFQDGNKQPVIDQWNRLKEVVKSLFPEKRSEASIVPPYDSYDIPYPPLPGEWNDYDSNDGCFEC